LTSPALDLHFPAAPGFGDLISAELHDLSPSAVHETEIGGRPVWRVFFATAEARDAARLALEARFAGDDIAVDSVDVADEDWAARSQSALRHVRVGRIVIAPPWDVPPDIRGDDILVVIRPSMGFGTGHHATTRLCLRLLQRIECAGKDVLDVGTGSGVLAIAAARLGAADVIGIDVDQDALASAEDSLALNSGAAVRFLPADVRDARQTADIVLANLTGAALVAGASHLFSCATSPGWLVLSGFQTYEAADVMAAFPGAVCETTETEEDWTAALIRKQR
jgi:ribosomal protein L11 methyltransferase